MKDRTEYDRLNTALTRYETAHGLLPGIANQAARDTLLRQFVASVHRVRYPRVVASRNISPVRADPADERFDPLKAAILHYRDGNVDEAFWLIFLFVHFGKHRKAGWRYAREFYGKLGQGGLWNWSAVSTNPSAVRQWLVENEPAIRRPGIPGGFGNHRKYESLNGHKDNGTGAAIESYVRWVNPPGSHQDLIQSAIGTSAGDRKKAFRLLYNSMKELKRFGRTARFDYVAMIGKLGFAPVEPDSTYMGEATGPVDGAHLLFTGSKGSQLGTRQLEGLVAQLDAQLGVGMQAMEDALCNWQKSPDIYEHFAG
jgi:hypothetical protein